MYFITSYDDNYATDVVHAVGHVRFEDANAAATLLVKHGATNVRVLKHVASAVLEPTVTIIKEATECKKT